jgi:FecR protein
MRRIILMLVPAALFAGQARYARLGEFEGKVEVQLQAADSWMPAERNLPLPESAWLRTAPRSRLEIELDEGSAWRLGPDSQGEISDYARLSTGQRITLLSLDRGLSYFTGVPKGKDALTLAVPGAQITFLRGARVRLEAGENWSRISILEGAVRFSSPAAEIDLHEGQTVRVEPANPSRFFLDREVASMELDRWSEQRDTAEAGSPSAGHVLGRYGLVDLDSAGVWIQTDDLGAVWKPKQQDGWYPFQQGRWRWYDTLGYTWVSDDAWGWLPYHYGRWQRKERLGWVWAPSVSTVFKPGDVYWLRGAKLAAWGPLGPREEWTPASRPEQFYDVNTTYATLQPDARVIDPSGFTERPKDPLVAAAFALALPGPAFVTARLDATRPVLRAGSTRVIPVLRGVTYDDQLMTPTPPPPPPLRPQQPLVIVTQTQTQDDAPPPETVVMPVYTGYIVTPHQGRDRKGPDARPTIPASTTTTSRTNRTTPPTVPHVEPTHEKKFRNAGESELYNAVLRDTNDPAKQIQDLDAWSQKYSQSDFIADRLYLYIQAYARLKPVRPRKVLEYGAQLMVNDLKAQFQDPQQVLVVLYLVTVNAAAIPNPRSEELAAGRAAARELLDGLPAFFAADRMPPNMTAADWKKSRSDMEATARKTLAGTLHASARY